jgi:predicted ATPase
VRDIIRPHAPELLQHLYTPVQPSDAMRSPRLLREIVAAVEALASDTPTVLALEDVHWLDQASIDAIGALARRRQRARLLLLVTCRPLEAFVDTADSLRRLIDELEMARAGNLIRLDSLTRLEVEQYASKRFSPEVAGELGGLLHAASGGRPLLLTAVTNAVVARGVVRRMAGRWSLAGGSREVSVAMVGAIGGFLERQIAQLSRGDRALLTSVSALGLEFSIWKAARITGRDPASVEQILDRLSRSGDVIVRADGRHTLDALATYRFTHPMYLEVLNSAAALVNAS